MKNLVTCECSEIFEDDDDFCEAECPRCFTTVDTTFAPAIKAENEYYADLEKDSESRRSSATSFYAGGYEASKGDYEGACLARAEFEAGYIS